MKDTNPIAQDAPQSDKQAAVKSYYDAATKEAKAEVVKKYPFLKEVFSSINHS